MRFPMMFAHTAVVAFLGGAVLAQAENQSPPPQVVVDTPIQVGEASPKRYVGAVEAIEHVDIIPRVTGNLLKIDFVEGSIVQQGSVLYELEDTTYRAAVDGLTAQKEELEAVLKFATAEFQRNNRLVKSEAISISAYDKALQDIDMAKAKLKATSALLTDAKNTLSYTRIYAPISGKIGKSTFTVGNLIAPQGGKLNDIEMIAPIYVRFSLSERVFRHDFGSDAGIKDRAIVRVQLADGTIYHEAAKITLIDNKINSTTNTVMLWATFRNQDKQLIPGSFVTVLVSRTADKPFIAITPSALIAEAGGYCVYVLDSENKVVRREVKTGDVADGLQIVLSGLSGTERVVVDGMNKVTPGMVVTPVAPDAVK